MRGLGVAPLAAVADVFAGSSLFGLNASMSTTSFVWTVGAGLPLRVLFRSAPPGPENKPPSAPLALPSPPSPFLPYLLSRNFITRRLSPSFRPNVRSNGGWTSGKISWPISSAAKARAYFSQICGLTPHCRKKSNQSYSGFFSIDAPAPPLSRSLAFCVPLRLMSDNGLSSSSETPVALSTYSRSSIDILVTGTAILTPFVL